MSPTASLRGPDPSDQPATDQLQALAAEFLGQQLPPREVVRRLVAEGFAAEAAAEAIAQLVQNRSASLKARGRRHVFYGAVWCIGGVLMGILTYQSSAAGPTGGRYAVAGAALTIGLLQFFWGVVKLAE